MKKRLVLLAIVTAGVLATTLFPPADVDVVTGATKKKKHSKKSGGQTQYFYLVVHADGKANIGEMTSAEAKKCTGELVKEHAGVKKKWLELKKRWHEDEKAGKFPFLPPKTPKCRQLAKTPANSKDRARALKKYKSTLDSWSACLATDHKGVQKKLALRRDGVFGAQRDLTLAYTEAVIAARGSADAAGAIKKPSFKILKSKLSSKQAAQKYLHRISDSVVTAKSGRYKHYKQGACGKGKQGACHLA